MNDKCKEWKEVENIDYSVYGTGIKLNNCSVDLSGWNVSNVTSHGYFTFYNEDKIIQPVWPTTS